MPNVGHKVMRHYSTSYRLGGSIGGDLLYSTEPLSFWGGVNPDSGEVIDRHHPLSGQIISDKILAIPSGRGSCTGSAIMLELIIKGMPPAGLILSERDEVLILGVMVAELFFGLSIPIAVLEKQDFDALSQDTYVSIENNTICALQEPLNTPSILFNIQKDIQQKDTKINATIELSDIDKQMLQGALGESKRLAMQLIYQIALLQKADSLIDVTQVHVDGCIYTGDASLNFAKKLAKIGASTVIPTTLNAISIDRQRWKDHDVQQEIAKSASELADAYVQMGAKPTYTCAPYLLSSAPKMNENIGWAESNAVVFANSVLGAHTQKYPDFLDICIAITGRAPKAGCHREEARVPLLRFDVSISGRVDDSFYPLIGYKIGAFAPRSIPLVCLPKNLKPNHDDLKAFGAAFATMSSAPMFHIDNITPESKLHPNWAMQCEKIYLITEKDILDIWHKLNQNENENIDLIALGNPHFSLEEACKLAELCENKQKNDTVDFIVTIGRDVFSHLKNTNNYQILKSFGVRFINDTCWCMLQKPTIKETVQTIMTNSGKYAHYGSGLTGCAMRFGSMSDCVSAAISGKYPKQEPDWLFRHNARKNVYV